MTKSMGDAAGELWAFLNEQGASSPSKVAKETSLSKTEIQRAIGWLAREEKIVIEVNGRTETLLLK